MWSHYYSTISIYYIILCYHNFKNHVNIKWAVYFLTKQFYDSSTLGQKFFKKIVGFLRESKTQNFPSEIIWPLVLSGLSTIPCRLPELTTWRQDVTRKQKLHDHEAALPGLVKPKNHKMHISILIPMYCHLDRKNC